MGSTGPRSRCRCWSRGCGTTSSSWACRSWPWGCWWSAGTPPGSWRRRRGSGWCCSRPPWAGSPSGSPGGRGAGRPGRPDWEREAVAFRAQAITLRGQRWHWVTLTTLASHLSLFLVLLLALRHVGVSEAEVSWVEALAAFALVRLLSAFPTPPGGLGVVELGLAGGLILAGGDEAQVVAAVLVFRLLTFVLPIPIGALTWWLWRRGAWYPLSVPEPT